MATSKRSTVYLRKTSEKFQIYRFFNWKFFSACTQYSYTIKIIIVKTIKYLLIIPILICNANVVYGML